MDGLEISPALACGASVPALVHLLVSANLAGAPQRLANQVMGNTCTRLQQKYPLPRSQQHNLWSQSYSVESAGLLSEERVNRYSSVSELRSNCGED
jgi:REP element-mobilizing transposase RayT